MMVRGCGIVLVSWCVCFGCLFGMFRITALHLKFSNCYWFACLFGMNSNTNQVAAEGVKRKGKQNACSYRPSSTINFCLKMLTYIIVVM